MADPDIVLKETDARFWAQSKHKPGQPLDPKNPIDKAMIPLWLDIRDKVRREYAAGKLVTTFDNPDVAKALADAQLADKVTAAYLDAAKDPWADTAVDTAAAATAAQVSAQKTDEAAALQPPTVSPTLAKDAAKEVAKTQPPPHAPAADHLAHSKAQALPRDVLYKETDVRFWLRYGYKTGQRLDPNDPKDKGMIPVWQGILREVEREAAAGKLVLTPWRPPAPQPPPSMQMPPRPPGMAMPTGMPPRPPWAMPPGMPPRLPPGMQMPPGMPTRPTAPPTTAPPPTPPTEVPAPPPAREEARPSPEAEAPPPKKKSAAGTIALVVLGLAAVGGIAYAATRRAPRHAQPRPRPRAPRVILATPTRVTPTRVTPARVVSARPSLPGLPPPRASRP